MSKLETAANQVAAWPIKDWCQRWDISTAKYFKMQARGEGPRVFRIGRLCRITPEAEQEWIRKQSKLEPSVREDA